MNLTEIYLNSEANKIRYIQEMIRRVIFYETRETTPLYEMGSPAQIVSTEKKRSLIHGTIEFKHPLTIQQYSLIDTLPKLSAYSMRSHQTEQYSPKERTFVELRLLENFHYYKKQYQMIATRVIRPEENTL